MSARRIKRKVMQRRRVVARWLPGDKLMAFIKRRRLEILASLAGADPKMPLEFGVVERFRFITSGQQNP